MRFLILFSSIIAVLMAAEAIETATIGSKMIMTFGPGVKALVRTVNGVEMTIQACDLLDQRMECSAWKLSNGQFFNGSPVMLLTDGRLVLFSVSASDYGSYTDADRSPIVRTSSDGTVYAVAKMEITLMSP